MYKEIFDGSSLTSTPIMGEMTLVQPITGLELEQLKSLLKPVLQATISFF